MPTPSGVDARRSGPPADWLRAKSVLTAAIPLPQQQRERFVEEACPDDPGLRDELLAILKNYDTATTVCKPAWTGGTTFMAVVPSLKALTRTPAGPVLDTGATYGAYRILKQLGAGGMGQVFLAEDVRLSRRVAIKSLAGQWLESPTSRQRLMQEARSVGALTHPNIATLYDVLETPGHLLLVMEYVEGRAISNLLDDGPIPLGHALRLAVQIVDAVSYAHDRGIIHCDLKPANVQVTVDGIAKVLDFGLARARYDLAHSDDSANPEQGKLVGTLGYMAPERVLNGTLNPAGDIYSLGVVIFEMITGRPFFDGTDLSAFLLEVMGGQVTKPSSLVPAIPAALDDIVERALATKPMMRYQSARELGRDLETVLGQLEPPGPTRVVTPPETRWTDRVLSGAAITAGIVFVFTLAGFTTSTMYDSALGITGDFRTESALTWPLWGLRSFVAPFILVGTVVAGGIPLLRALWRGALLALGAGRRTRLLETGRVVTQRVGTWSIDTRALVLFLIHIAAISMTLLWFGGFVKGLDSLLVPGPGGDISALRPGNRGEHSLYRQLMSLELWIFALSWYHLVRLGLKRRERSGLAGLIGGITLTLWTVMLLVLPYRLLIHNEHERVQYRQQTCYLMGERGTDALLFCPQQNPPRNQIVGLSDPQLERGGPEEDVFSELDRVH